MLSKRMEDVYAVLGIQTFFSISVKTSGFVVRIKLLTLTMELFC